MIRPRVDDLEARRLKEICNGMRKRCTEGIVSALRRKAHRNDSLKL